MDYDIIIIGAGPAGVTAAIYADRAGLKTLILEKMYVGGQIVNTYEVENYPGFTQILGTDLAIKFTEHIRAFPNIDFKREDAKTLSLSGDVKTVTTKKNSYTAKTLVLAMGSSPRRLGVPGEERLRGRGVSYCGTCDGALYRDQTVAVVGGGNSAIEDVIFLSRLCKKVHLIHRRDEFRAHKKMTENMLQLPNIEVHYDSVTEEILGENAVNELKIKNVKTDAISTLNVACVFVTIGQIPSNDLVKGTITLDELGYIVTDNTLATNIPGVFAAGDGRNNILKQIVTAAADGAIAAYGASVYIAGL
ncbi:MAG: thioredoxin-disulfide reductase [Defluviitaleaceae bacterium]|nr:thioredoxin-disulfide reductase [Defluviitaleaceae bacterium]